MRYGAYAHITRRDGGVLIKLSELMCDLDVDKSANTIVDYLAIFML